MKVGNEVENVFYDFPVDLNKKEQIFFFEYARNKMSEETFERVMMEWALTDIVTKNLEKDIVKLTKEGVMTND